jgi:hypothetical protein
VCIINLDRVCCLRFEVSLSVFVAFPVNHIRIEARSVRIEDKIPKNSISNLLLIL